MNQIVVDYETYYDTKQGISVTAQAIKNYVAGADAYILAVVCDEFEWVGTVGQARDQFPAAFWQDPGNQFYAANAVFDESWHEKYFPKTAHPWECLLDMGVYHQLGRSLPALAKQVLGVKVDKTTRTEMDGVDYDTLPDARQQEVNDYCLNDGVQELKILRALKPMSAVEGKIAALTRRQNRRGIHIDLERVAADKTFLAEMKHKALLDIPWHTGAAPLSPNALAEWCGLRGIPAPQSVDKKNEDCAALMKKHPELGAIIHTLRQYRFANNMLMKSESLLERVYDGIIPLELLYCGAPHTRRWSSKGFNVQNLPKEPTIVSGSWDVKTLMKAIQKHDPIPDDVHYFWLRNWLIPPPGQTFLIFDYSQIEPRVLNWLVGNEKMMAAIRSGFSIYEAYARAAKGWKGAAGTLKKEWDLRSYTLLKNECLGCGYGMGADRMQSYVAENGGGVITKTEAQNLVDGYRKANQLITGLWKKLDNHIYTAARSRDHVLEVEMPSGDKLIHWDVKEHSTGGKSSFKSTTTKGDYSQQSIQNRLWGGTLTENVTQRCARDILAEAMVRLEEAGLPVIFSAHDEVILAVPDDASKEEAKRAAEEILTTPPEWAPDLPLGVEGDFAHCYLK